MNPKITTVIQNGKGEFLVTQEGTKWSSEYPDAYQFPTMRDACKWGKLLVDSPRPILAIFGHGTIVARINTILQ